MQFGRGVIESAAVLCTFAVLWSLAIPGDARAESGVHQHGVGHLNIAVEGRHVEIELVVPGADIVGFEHAPATRADRNAVKAAAHSLEDGKNLFAFAPAANCVFEKAEVQSGLLVSHHKQDAHAHEKEGHHKGHAPESKGHEHKGHKHKEHAAKEVHGEFRVHYHVACAQVAALKYIDVLFFKPFPNAEKLITRWITPGGQGAATLTASASRLNF